MRKTTTILALGVLTICGQFVTAQTQVPLDLSPAFNMDAVCGPKEFQVLLIDGTQDLIELFGDYPEGNGRYVYDTHNWVIAASNGAEYAYSIPTAPPTATVNYTAADGLPSDGVVDGADRLYHMPSVFGNATLPGDWTETADPSDFSSQPNCIAVGALHDKSAWQVESVTFELPAAQKGPYQDINFVLAAQDVAHKARSMRIVALYGPDGATEVVLYAFRTDADDGPLMIEPAPAGFLAVHPFGLHYSSYSGTTTGTVRTPGGSYFEFDGAIALDSGQDLWGIRIEDTNPTVNWYARGVTVFAATATKAAGANTAPVADAGADQTVVDHDDDGFADVALDGSASADAEGILLRATWTESAAPVAAGIAPIATLAVGSHTLTLTVTDSDGVTDTDTVQIEVDAPPPGSPVAVAGPDRTIFDADDSGDELVTLDGSASVDPDGTLVSWIWTESDVEIATGETAPVTLVVGVHDITLTVTDNDARTGADTMTVTVLAYRAPGFWYVDDAAGNDANVGSEAAPFKTIQRAATGVAAGDTVIVRPGEYDQKITVTRSGAEGNLVTFRGEPSRQARVQGFVLQGDYLSVEGFEITNSAAAGNGIYAGEFARGTAQTGCRMIDNFIHDIDGKAIFTGTDALVRDNLMRNVGWGLMVDSRTLVANNEIDRLVPTLVNGDYRAAKYAFFAGDDITFRGNYFHGTPMDHVFEMSVDFFGSHDAWLYGPSHRILIENNRCFNATHASEPGAGVYHQSSHITYRNNLFVNTVYVGVLCKNWSDITIVNNTFINCGAYPVWFQTVRETQGSTVRNNLISYWNHVPPPGGLVSESGVRNDGSHVLLDCDYNMFWGCLNRGYGANDFDAEPQFVDPANGDFRLMPGSPGIDAGSPILAPAFDMIGTPRPAGMGYDVGAWELSDDQPGDADGDGDVDLDDFVIFKQNFGTPSGATQADGDFDGDGDVDLDDFVILKQNFGT